MSGDRPYRAEVDHDGCEHCGAGRTWTVVGPDDIAIGQSFGDKEAAEDLASHMSHAWDEAKRDSDAEWGCP